MATTLANREELRYAFYRLTGSSSDDGALSEHQDSANDTVHAYLYQGMREAQWYIVSRVSPERWKKRSSAITWSGTESADGGRYTSLPTDFLKLFGESDNSALREANGQRWGRLIPIEERTRRGDYYWIEDDELWIARDARPPSTVYMDYNYEAPELTDDSTEPDFPEIDRPLIVAFAADLYADSPMFPGDTELYSKIKRHLAMWKERVYTRGRRTREPRKVRHPPALGSRWMSRG